MDIAVPSRFACLKIEDDDFRPAKSKDSKKKVDVKQGAKKQEKGSKQNTVNNNVKKSGSKPQQQQQPQVSQNVGVIFVFTYIPRL